MALVEGEDFGQERPPLAVVIKSILQDYPCGQIFKVRSVLNTCTVIAKVVQMLTEFYF